MKFFLNTLDPGINDYQSVEVLRQLRQRQDSGELRTSDQIQQELGRFLTEVNSRGCITQDLVVPSWEAIHSTDLDRFHENIKADLGILFQSSDTLEFLIDNIKTLIEAQLLSLEFSLGQLRSEYQKHQFQVPPGSGWSTIIQDSFDHGYGQLAGKADLPPYFFTGKNSNNETNEESLIIADARLGGIGKKLVLSEQKTESIGFRRLIVHNVSGTFGNIPFETGLPPENAIDGSEDTFWLHAALHTQSLIGVPTVTALQVAGPQTNAVLTFNLSGILDPRRQDYFVHFLNSSGYYRCYADLTQQTLPDHCIYDQGSSCQWNYQHFYNANCTNQVCARRTSYNHHLVSGVGVLEDGYHNDTGIRIGVSGTISPGQIWRISVVPSGLPGLLAEIELELTRPNQINWIELNPVADAPFFLRKIEYSSPGISGRLPLISGNFELSDRFRLDFRPVEVERLYFLVQQESVVHLDMQVRTSQVGLGKVLTLRDQKLDPSLNDFYALPLEFLITPYLPHGFSRYFLEPSTEESQNLTGFLYQFGLFNATCGLTSYQEVSLAVTKPVRVTTPRVFAVQSNLGPGSNFAIPAVNYGTVEFSVFRENYDQQSKLINIEEFSLPDVDPEGCVIERVFLDSSRQGSLRFAAASIVSVRVLNLSRTLETDDYAVVTTGDGLIKSVLTIDRPDVGSNSIVVVRYRPRTGVYLDANHNLKLEDNTLGRFTLSYPKFIVVVSPRINHRDIAYSDVYLRILLRRNDLNVNTTPSLRNFHLLISEADPSRFF